MMEIIFGIVFFLFVAAMVGFLCYHYYQVTRKRKTIMRNDVFLFLFGGFVAGMFFLSLLRFLFGTHTNGLFDNSPYDHGKANNEYYICYEIDKQAE